MKTIQKKARFIPIWISGLILIELILIVGVTIGAIQDITIMHPDQSGQSYLSSLYIVRNLIACAGLALTAYVFRSYIALFVAFASRIATEIADFTNSYLYERSPDILSTIPYLAFLMVIVPSLAIFILWPNVKKEIALLKQSH